MSNPRILMINNHIHFGGGGDAAFRHEKLIYEEEGYDVYTFSMASSVPDDLTDNDIVSVVSDKSYRNKISKYLGNKGITNDLKLALDKINPHLVHVHLVSDYPISIYSALASYPVIHTLHGPNLFCATSWGCIKSNSKLCEMGVGIKCLKNKCVSLKTFPLQYELAKRSEYWCKKNILAYLCPSKQIKASAESLGYTPAIYLPLSIDREFENIELEKPGDIPTILFVGALVEQKGLYYLIEALDQILEVMPETILKIAGRGVMEAQLQTMIKDKGIESSVQFLGFCSRDEVIGLYKKSTVLAVPSIWKEQFGLVGPEALACGLPAVGSDIGGIPEWLEDGRGGYLARPRDSSDLADKLLRIIKDKDLRDAMSVKGREFILNNFSPRKYKENILNVVNKYKRLD